MNGPLGNTERILLYKVALTYYTRYFLPHSISKCLFNVCNNKDNNNNKLKFSVCLFVCFLVVSCCYDIPTVQHSDFKSKNNINFSIYLFFFYEKEKQKNVERKGSILQKNRLVTVWCVLLSSATFSSFSNAAWNCSNKNVSCEIYVWNERENKIDE